MVNDKKYDMNVAKERLPDATIREGTHHDVGELGSLEELAHDCPDSCQKLCQPSPAPERGVADDAARYCSLSPDNFHTIESKPRTSEGVGDPKNAANAPFYCDAGQDQTVLDTLIAANEETRKALCTPKSESEHVGENKLETRANVEERVQEATLEQALVQRLGCESYALFQSALDDVLVTTVNPASGFSPDNRLSKDFLKPGKPRRERYELTYGERVIPLHDLNPHPSVQQMGAETMPQFKARIINVIQQMMYVSGETAEPSVDTTSIIEDAVRQQVIELVSSPEFPAQ